VARQGSTQKLIGSLLGQVCFYFPPKEDQTRDPAPKSGILWGNGFQRYIVGHIYKASAAQLVHWCFESRERLRQERLQYGYALVNRLRLLI